MSVRTDRGELPGAWGRRFAWEGNTVNGLSFGEKAQLCWAFWWRGAAVGVLTTLISALVGALLGALLGVLQVPLGAITITCAIVGFVPGAVGLYFYFSWLLRSRLGGRWRLVLVDDAQRETGPETARAPDELAGLPNSFLTSATRDVAYDAAKAALKTAWIALEHAHRSAEGLPAESPEFRVLCAAAHVVTAAYGRALAISRIPVES